VSAISVESARSFVASADLPAVARARDAAPPPSTVDIKSLPDLR
jgi:hypothetical protein